MNYIATIKTGEVVAYDPGNSPKFSPDSYILYLQLKAENELDAYSQAKGFLDSNSSSLPRNKLAFHGL